MKFSCFENIGDVPVTYPWWGATIDNINTLITYLIFDVRTRNQFEIKSRDQVEYVTYQLHRS